MRKDDEFWKEVLAEYSTLYTENKEDEFATELLKAVWNEMRREYKRMMKEEWEND